MADFVTDFVADCVTDFGIFVTFKSLSIKAGSHRNDYERIQLKTDLRLVKIIKSK